MVNLFLNLITVIISIVFFTEIFWCVCNYNSCNQFEDDNKGWLTYKMTIGEEKKYIKNKFLCITMSLFTSIIVVLKMMVGLEISKYFIITLCIISLLLLKETYPVVENMYKEMLLFKKNSKYYTDFSGNDYDFYTKLKQDRRYYLYGLAYNILVIIYFIIW